MQRLANGEHVEPIHLRKGDFWKELAGDFNMVLQRMQTDSPANAHPDTPTTADPEMLVESTLKETEKLMLGSQ